MKQHFFPTPHHYQARAHCQHIDPAIGGSETVTVRTFRKRLGKNAWGVWLALTRLRKYDGKVWPSYSWIARTAGSLTSQTMNHKAVEYAIRRLRKIGLIQNHGHDVVWHTKRECDVIAFTRTVYGCFARAKNGFKCISLPVWTIKRLFEKIHPRGGDRREQPNLHFFDLRKLTGRRFINRPFFVPKIASSGHRSTTYFQNKHAPLSPTSIKAKPFSLSSPAPQTPMASLRKKQEPNSSLMSLLRGSKRDNMSDNINITDKKTPSANANASTNADAPDLGTNVPFSVSDFGSRRAPLHRLDDLDRRWPGIVPKHPVTMVPRISSPSVPHFKSSTSPTQRAKHFALLYTGWMWDRYKIKVKRYKKAISKVKEFKEIVELTDALIFHDLSPVEWLGFCESFWLNYGPKDRRELPPSLFFILSVKKVEKYRGWARNRFRNTSQTPVIISKDMLDVIKHYNALTNYVLYNRIDSPAKLKEVCDLFLPPDWLQKKVAAASNYVLQSSDSLNESFNKGVWLW